MFSSATRLLALLETFAGVPDRQVDTLGGRGVIMEYGSTPYVGWHGKKWRPHITRTKSYVQSSTLITVIGFYEPYHDISSVFISNKTVSVARKLRWSTIPASRHTRGAGRNGLLLSFFLSFFLSSSARLAR